MKVVIIGGVAAGMSAASKLKRLDNQANIIVYEKGKDLSYSGCGMPYYLGDIVTDEQKLVARTKEDFLAQGIDVFLRHEVIKLNPQEKSVVVKNLETNEQFIEKYDKLLIGTGTTANRTNTPGSEKVKVHVLNQLEDMRALKPIVDKAKSVAVIGGGYIGIEVAENLIHKGLNVEIIELAPQLLTVYDKAIAQKAQDALEQKGVKVHLNEKLLNYDLENNKAIITTDKATYKVDLIIEAIGVRPATAFLKDTGLEMIRNGAIVINDKCETSLKDVYAAGDCVAYHHLIKNELAYVPLGTHANKTGRIVAENMVGIDSRFNGIVGSNIIKVTDLAFAKTGIGIDEAKKLNLDYDYVDVNAKNQTGYYPGAKSIFMRIVYEKSTGILKGAQLVGEKGVSDRINIMALAITKSLTAKEFSQLDFAYAPPFSPVWDPLLVAANRIKV
ncbi:MAG: CoA-disulfide reductase [Candidatus Izemoplasmatales bacterium]|nr:CoA-disulfide reductase [Candidatus Izemoplasmatales bacterium]